ncbi:MAG: hypothetical protein AB1847_09790 [bacterium]
MNKNKIWLWWLAALVVAMAGMVCNVPGGETAESSSRSVYIFKEVEWYTQENLRVQFKSRYSFIISLRVGTAGGESRWINFTPSAGSASYQADLIEIPLNRSFTDGEWHEIEILDLKAILSQGGDVYDHLEKIGIRGEDFQLADIELFSNDAGTPSNVQVMSFDNPAASDMNQYGWYSHDSSGQFTLHYLPEGNYLQVTGPASPSQTTSSTASAASSYPATGSQSPFGTGSGPYSNSSLFWSSGPVYPFYVPPIPSPPPLFGLGYSSLPPYGYGPQPVLSFLTLGGLSSYFNDPNPGYPYSVGGYNFANLFATGSSPYPYASPFPAQAYGYLASPLAVADPTYNIYNSSVTSTLAPAATISGLITTGFYGGGVGGLGGVGGGGALI